MAEKNDSGSSARMRILKLRAEGDGQYYSSGSPVASCLSGAWIEPNLAPKRKDTIFLLVVASEFRSNSCVKPRFPPMETSKKMQDSETACLFYFDSGWKRKFQKMHYKNQPGQVVLSWFQVTGKDDNQSFLGEDILNPSIKSDIN